jgi:hypothetical protein
MKVRNIFKGAVAAIGAVALSLSLATTASAAGLDKSAEPGTELNTYVRQTQTVRDAGGQEFTASVLWTETYQTESGNFRVGATVSINASGTDLDEDGPGDGGLDATVKTYQGYADGHVKLIQDKTFDGVEDPFKFNNANPLNRPLGSKVVITAGVNDDGHANSAPLTFVQPVVGDEDPGADGEAEVGDPDHV